jgi:nitronate monooxygenase
MQAPIGPAATAELVASVSATGALGTLAASWTPLAELSEELAWLRSSCTPPFCVNLVLAFEQRERLMTALDSGASFVSFSWGLDAELIRAARNAGAYVLVQVGTLAEAREAAAAKADALIVQGVEAGGHVQSKAPLLKLRGGQTGAQDPACRCGRNRRYRRRC